MRRAAPSVSNPLGQRCKRQSSQLAQTRAENNQLKEDLNRKDSANQELTQERKELLDHVTKLWAENAQAQALLEDARAVIESRWGDLSRVYRLPTEVLNELRAFLAQHQK